MYFVSTIRRDVWSEKEIETKINTMQREAHFTSKIRQAPASKKTSYSRPASQTSTVLN